jgi:hypothetical protein
MEHNFFDFSEIEKLRKESIQTFTYDNLDIYKVEIRKNIAEKGYHIIKDDSVGDVKKQKSDAIIKWFHSQGVPVGKVWLEYTDSGWSLFISKELRPLPRLGKGN